MITGLGTFKEKSGIDCLSSLRLPYGRLGRDTEEHPLRVHQLPIYQRQNLKFRDSDMAAGLLDVETVLH